MSWSGGKDSSLCLYELQTNKSFENIEIKALLTTLTSDYNRISIHGVRKDLLLAQSESIGMPVEEVWITATASNKEYEAELSKSLERIKHQANPSTVIFGDLFLEDIRSYREKSLRNLGFECMFPLWRRNTRDLARYFIDCGFKAIICAVDPKKLDSVFCGREFDRGFLSEIPVKVDPCGENGEFHTFVYGGPIFRRDLQISIEKILERNGHYFSDISLV